VQLKELLKGHAVEIEQIATTEVCDGYRGDEADTLPFGVDENKGRGRARQHQVGLLLKFVPSIVVEHISWLRPFCLPQEAFSYNVGADMDFSDPEEVSAMTRLFSSSA